MGSILAQEDIRRKRAGRLAKRMGGPDREDLPIPHVVTGAENWRVPLFVLSHRHEPEECGSAYAAWKGFDSPLRHRITLASCVEGAHGAWWQVEARNPEAALAQLPPFVRERTAVERARGQHTSILSQEWRCRHLGRGRDREVLPIPPGGARG
jgi:hypothetical protein